MPIYEFFCESCSNEFEKIVPFSATSTPDCPSCSSSNVKRQLSKPAIHFKGSGWYITDSKTSNGNSNGNGHGSNGVEKAKNGEAGQDSGSTETKSETKSNTTDSEPVKSKSTESTAVKADA